MKKTATVINKVYDCRMVKKSIIIMFLTSMACAGDPNDPTRIIMGIYYNDLNKKTVARLKENGMGLPVAKGVIVIGIQPLSPAEHAGLKSDDIIVAVAANRVSDVNSFYRATSFLRKHQPITLEILHYTGTKWDRRKIELTPITLAEQQLRLREKTVSVNNGEKKYLSRPFAVGQIGLLNQAVVTEVYDNNSAQIKLPFFRVDHGRVLGTEYDFFYIDGVDTTQMVCDQKFEPAMRFKIVGSKRRGTMNLFS